MRTVRFILSDNCETYADVLRMRWDWLVLDSSNEYGTTEAIQFSIMNCKEQLSKLDDELRKLKLQLPNGDSLASNLREYDRRTSQQVSLFDDLVELGLKPIE